MPKTLLLADDSVTIQKVVGISFANEDFVLETVDNGDAAVERAAEIRPDIVLADVVMPGKSGYEVCETIKANPDLAGVPVLLLTGTFEAFDEDRARQAGADGHITKPFEAQALVDAVKQRLAAVPASADPGTSEAPAPVIAVPNDGFDFLEDDQTEPSGLAAAAQDAQPSTPIGEPDPGTGGHGAFAFEAPGEDGSDLGIGGLGSGANTEPDQSAPDLEPESAPDRTQLVMPEDPATADTLPPADLAPEPLLQPSPEAQGLDSDDATRVVFAERGEPLVPSGDLLGDPLAAMPEDDAVLDPTGARDYDVSSSDLGEPVPSTTPEKNTAPQPASPFDLPAEVPSEAGPFGLAPQVPDFADVAAAPDAASEPAAVELAPEVANAAESYTSPFDDDFPAEAAPAEEAAQPEPGGDRDVAILAGVESDFGSDPSLPEPLAAAPEPIVEAPAVALQADAEPTAADTPAVPDLGPLLRDQLHDTLEKIAWEAFGEVAEAIVKQTLERVEQVAWEVIPQMAETLIQEEIRKLKGEGSD
jgi:CheY-like chemotaxis protein